MRLAVIGLGRTGGSIVCRLMRGGHECVEFGGHLEQPCREVTDGPAIRFSSSTLAARTSRCS